MSLTPQVTYPGVYIQELPSAVHTITGVATSITAFVGYTARGRDNKAIEVQSFSDFQRAFGGLAADSELSYEVQQFFANGGSDAFIVRVPKDGAQLARIRALDAAKNPSLDITAISTGVWGNNVIVDVDYDGIASNDTKSFNLTITDLDTGTIETFDGVTMDNTLNNFVETIVNDDDTGSNLVRITSYPANGRPAETGVVGAAITFPINPGAYSINVSSDSPANTINNLTIQLLAASDTPPSSVAGLCSLLESRIQAQLQTALNSSTISLQPSDSGNYIRIRATLPAAYDAVLTFSTATPSDILMLTAPTSTNVAHYWLGDGAAKNYQQNPTPGSDGNGLPTATELIGNGAPDFTGIYALEKVDLFNLLCIPDVTRAKAGSPGQPDLLATDQNSVWDTAISYCKSRRAFLLVDPPPNVSDVQSAADWITQGLSLNDENGAAYFPRVKSPDSLNNNQLRAFAPCGVMAGLYARTDSTRGVWKAPAGTEASLTGVQALVYNLTDPENGKLNPLGLNCLRVFPVYGSVSWGARTLAGSDQEGSQWKYVPVRRFALYLEESLYRGTKWVVFEPNAEPLWAQIRLNIGAFMQDLFRQGAFQGQTPQQAYFVKCDDETTTQTDINNGIVNILVGFAPLKPAEFVVIKISQIAGQIQT